MSEFNCPNCGAALSVRAAERASSFTPPWRAHKMTTHKLGGGEGDTFTELTRTVPGRAASVASDIHVPLLGTVITAVAVTLPLAALTAAGGWSPAVPVFGFAATFAASWLYLSADARSLLRTVEKAVQRDLNHDGVVGSPAVVEPPEPVRVEVAERRDDGRLTAMKFITLPPGLDESALYDFAAGVVGGRSLAESTWCGAGAPFSKTQYHALRDELIGRGYAEWNGGPGSAQGWKLNRKGQLMFGALRAAAVNRASLPPYPDGDNGAHAG